MSNYRRYFITNNPVFITFITYNRQNILIENIDILRQSFKLAKSKYNFEIIAISVMPNHCHMIISANTPDEISKIIRAIKYNFSINVSDKFVSQNLTESALRRGEKGIWQRRYYDHIIRNQNDFFRHIDYIHYNSMKHYQIVPKDWDYSSFKNFVKNGYYDENWCNVDDKNNINIMNYE